MVGYTLAAEASNIQSTCLVHDDKDVIAVDHVPIATLAVPVPVFVRMPVRIVPVVVRVHHGAARTVHDLSGVKGEPITEPPSLSAEDAITELFNSAADKFSPSAAIFSPPLVFGLPAPFRKRL